MKLQIHGKFDPSSNETYIGLIDVNRIPYHLLVVSGGKQFSWKVKRPRIGENVKTLNRHLEKNGISCVFLRISEDDSTLRKVEDAYSTPKVESTCIGPILKLVNSLGVEFNHEPLTIFELIDELENANYRTQVFGLNVEPNEYSRSEVDQHISQLLGELPQ